MEINIQLINNLTVVGFPFTNRLTLALTDEMTEQLLPVISSPNAHVVLDLTGIEYVDSSAIGCFIALAKGGMPFDASLTICNVGEAVSQIFDMLNLSVFLRIEKDLEGCRQELA